MKDNAIERWVAYLLICGSYQDKYGTLTKGFVSHYYLVKYQYPIYIRTATDALLNHKIHQYYYDNQKRNRDKSRSNHKNRETDNEGNLRRIYHQDLSWYWCGNKGHTSNYFDNRITTLHAKWACNMTMQHLQDGEGTDTANSDNVSKLSDYDRSAHSNTSTSSHSHRSGNRNMCNQERNQENDNLRPSWSQKFQ